MSIDDTYKAITTLDLISELEANSAIKAAADSKCKAISKELADRANPQIETAFSEGDGLTRRFILRDTNNIEVKAVKSTDVTWDSEKIMASLGKISALTEGTPFGLVKVKASVSEADYAAIEKTNQPLADLLRDARTTKPNPVKLTFSRKETS